MRRRGLIGKKSQEFFVFCTVSINVEVSRVNRRYELKTVLGTVHHGKIHLSLNHETCLAYKNGKYDIEE